MLLKLARLLAKWLPPALRYRIQRYVSLTNLKMRLREEDNPHSDVLESLTNPANSPFVFGIVRNYSHYHKYFVAACLELGVPFRVVDITGSNWMTTIKKSGCDVFLVWPEATLTIWNEMVNNRVRIMHEELGLVIHPTVKEIWLYEHKTRLSDWLEAHEIPRPGTRVFYDENECLEYGNKCDIPVVLKTDFGATASGVKIIRTRAQLLRTVKQAFHKGLVPNGFDKRDRQWGCVFLQEYLPNVKEWRLVRVGDSYFCRQKERLGDYHSGSGIVLWAAAPTVLLDLTKRITDENGFRSMNIDYFETEDGTYLVNELHTVFGEIRKENLNKNDENMGKYIYDNKSNEWQFEKGFFYDNACANERLKYLLEHASELAIKTTKTDSTVRNH